MLAPLNVTIRRAEFKYSADWTPISFNLDATVNGGAAQLRTTFVDGKAHTEGIGRGQQIGTRTTLRGRPSFMPTASSPRTSRSRSPPESSERVPSSRSTSCRRREVSVRVQAIRSERIQIGTTVLDVRRYELVYVNPSARSRPTSRSPATADSSASASPPIHWTSFATMSRLHVADPGLLEPGRRSGHHPCRRLQPRRDDHASGKRRRPTPSCPPSFCSPRRASAIATASSRACRRWRSWRAQSPRPASWRCASTSVDTDRAAAARNRRRSATTPKTCARSSGGSRSDRTSIPSASRSSVTAKAPGWPAGGGAREAHRSGGLDRRPLDNRRRDRARAAASRARSD